MEDTEDKPVGNADEVCVSVLIAYTPSGRADDLSTFADQLGRDAEAALARASRARWRFDLSEAYRLPNDDARYPSDFLRAALLHMVESSADVVLVVTDAILVSTSDRVVPGLAAPEANVAVVSTRKLLTAPFGEPVRPLDAESVRWNAATILVHLLGHMLALNHEREGVMAPFSFDVDRRAVPPFGPLAAPRLSDAVDTVVEREREVHGALQKLRIHLVAAARDPRDVLMPSLRTPAPLLPLSLAKITTAAITPTFIVLFTDEFWWIGLHLDEVFLWTAAMGAILTGSWFIPVSQQLFFPHREKRVIAHHVAIVNMAVLVAVFLMMVSLFVIVVLLVLLVEWWLFPPQYIAMWFEGRGFVLGWKERFDIALVVSTIGALTGALGSSFHGRDVLRAIAIFQQEP